MKKTRVKNHPYINVGGTSVIPKEDILGVFDLDTANTKTDTKRYLASMEQMKRLEKRLLPPDLDYSTITGLRLEAQEKLNRVKPLNIGQASRISGVNPADISVLLIRMSGNEENND